MAEHLRIEGNWLAVQAHLTEAMRPLRAFLASIPPETIAQGAEISQRVLASRELPKDDAKAIWATVGGKFTHAEIDELRLLEYWPDPIERRGGGGASTINTPENLSEFERRIASGQTQKAAAQAIFEGLESAEHKGDHLIKYWRKQRKLMGQ